MLNRRWIAAGLAGAAIGLAGHLGGSRLAAQTPTAGAPPAAAAGPANLEEVDPIRCWWRTSTSAVRVGEPFSLVLTCAVVENQTATVVPDQSKLEPGSIQLQPFDVLGGQHSPDLRGPERRFFQYEYTLRLIGEDLFGRDTHIPPLQIEYTLDSRVGGESVRGRARTYLLPAVPMRVLSLVTLDAPDIRDLPSLTFSSIDAERFRARVFGVAAAVLAAAGALVVLLALVRLVRSRRDVGIVSRPLLSNGSLVRAAARELKAVRRQRQAEGWSDALAARALAALRIAATIAQSGRVSQAPAGGGTSGLAGQLSMRGGFLWTRRVLVSGSATAEGVSHEAASASTGSARRECLTGLRTALARFTGAQFSREGTFDDLALDEGMADALGALRRLAIEQLWPVRKLRGLTVFGMAVGSRAWSR